MSMPLQGVKVLDIGWVMVGPYSGRTLSDLGADVVKLESKKRIDPLRTIGAFKDGIEGPERSVSYHNLNAGKRSLSLNLASPEGREAALRLVDWADVVVESFRPGVLDALDLGWPVLHARNPRLVMVSTSLLGSTGPHAQGAPGVGTMGGAMSGATLMVGWPGETPCGPYGPWTDAVAPRFIVPSILAALHDRRRTGRGMLIDVSQAEAGLQFYAPLAYQYAADGETPAAAGIASAVLRAPHGVYPCLGDDRWIAIDASADGHWRRLREQVGGALLAPDFDLLLDRLRDSTRLDRLIGAWTAKADANELERQLQAAGVPAHAVSTAEDLAADPELIVDHYVQIDDPVIGTASIEGPRIRLGRSALSETRRAPLIGEHSRQILEEACGYRPEKIDALEAAGALE